jgi:diguanylate cyclase (GGDEF)-like protein
MNVHRRPPTRHATPPPAPGSPDPLDTLEQQALQARGAELHSLRRALAQARQAAAGAPARLARIELILANLEEMRSPRALTHADDALRHATAAADASLQLRARFAAAKIWFAAGDPAQVLLELEHALPALQHEVQPRHRFEALQLLAAAAARLGQFERALEWQQQALGLAVEQTGQPAGGRWQAGALTNLAATLAHQAEAAHRRGERQGCIEASRHAEQAARQALADGAIAAVPSMQLAALANLGCSLVHQERDAQALQVLAQVEARAVELALPLTALQAAPMHARAMARSGRRGDARALLHASLQQAQALAREGAAQELHAELAALEKQDGHFESALQHHEAFHALYARYHSAAAEQRAALMAVRLRQEQLESQLRTELERAHTLRRDAEHWQHAALVDELTGLANRRQLDLRLPELHRLARAQRQALPLALMDVDHFKRINDRFSHLAGDAVLRHVGQLLREHCREGDLAARWGGDEFVLVQFGAPLEGARATCQRLRDAVAGHDWHMLAADLTLTLSIGLTDAGEAADLATAFERADQALLAAKAGGRNELR